MENIVLPKASLDLSDCEMTWCDAYNIATLHLSTKWIPIRNTIFGDWKNKFDASYLSNSIHLSKQKGKARLAMAKEWQKIYQEQFEMWKALDGDDRKGCR